MTDKYGYKKIKGHPEINFAEADREGPYIQFFEQAFEWPLSHVPPQVCREVRGFAVQLAAPRYMTNMLLALLFG